MCLSVFLAVMNAAFYPSLVYATSVESVKILTSVRTALRLRNIVPIHLLELLNLVSFSIKVLEKLLLCNSKILNR